MATLRETKDRIGSVRSTLKVTGAMKLVSSAKLRKAQLAIEAMRPYEEQLGRMLSRLSAQGGGVESASTAKGRIWVAIASNVSLCGAFNANVIAKVRSLRGKGDTVYAIGRKVAEAMQRDGFRSPEELSALSERPSYAAAAALARRLMAAFASGGVARVDLVYTHFVSTAHQKVVVEALLPAVPKACGEGACEQGNVPPGDMGMDCLVEPSVSEVLGQLLPKVVELRLYAALLDSAASEHAARTLAMQTATDNGEDLLDELTLQYNKGRQQKITAEILDLVGGQLA